HRARGGAPVSAAAVTASGHLGQGLAAHRRTAPSIYARGLTAQDHHPPRDPPSGAAELAKIDARGRRTPSLAPAVPPHGLRAGRDRALEQRPDETAREIVDPQRHDARPGDAESDRGVRARRRAREALEEG